jgi:hypothetical protein
VGICEGGAGVLKEIRVLLRRRIPISCRRVEYEIICEEPGGDGRQDTGKAGEGGRARLAKTAAKLEVRKAKVETARRAYEAAQAAFQAGAVPNNQPQSTSYDSDDGDDE